MACTAFASLTYHAIFLAARLAGLDLWVMSATAFLNAPHADFN